MSDGVITLTGSVPTWAARAHAGVVAAGIAGVQDVRNELRVRTSTALPDPEIAERVERRLERSGTTAFVANRIRVEVDLGVVRLSGDVDTWGQWRAAQRIARRTAGARAVQNELGVDPYPFALDPPAEPTPGWLDHDPPYAAQP